MEDSIKKGPEANKSSEISKISQYNKSSDASRTSEVNKPSQISKSPEAVKGHVANKPSEAFKITGNWSTQAKELKGKYAQLTDEDLRFEAGKEHELLKRVETRLGKGREEVINIIKKGQKETV